MVIKYSYKKWYWNLNNIRNRILECIKVDMSDKRLR